MPELAPEVREALERVRKAAPNLRSGDITPQESRAMQLKYLPAFTRLPLRDMEKVEDRSIPGPGGPIAIRICTPKSSMPGGTARPVCLFFHTGGFVFGSLDSDDPQCRHLADASGCIMVSVDYRLAPENKFPSACEDAIAAWDWITTHAKEIGGDGVRFAVSGGSAGGNLTANVCRHARDRGAITPVFQLVFVGGFNVPHGSVASHALHSLGGSNEEFARMVRTAYIRSEADQKDIRYAPLISNDFNNFPPAMVVVGECDGMRDEGALYSQKLKASGVTVELYEARGQVHQVFSWAGAFPEGPKVIERGGAALRSAMTDVSRAS